MAVTSGSKPVSADTKRRYLIQRAGYVLLTVATLVVVVPILYVVGMIVVRGIAAINWEFIFGMPSNGMKSGGIWPAIVGTVVLTITTAVISIPLGIGGAIYLSE
jgi:phosphate transport system permease protein